MCLTNVYKQLQIYLKMFVLNACLGKPFVTETAKFAVKFMSRADLRSQDVIFENQLE